MAEIAEILAAQDVAAIFPWEKYFCDFCHFCGTLNTLLRAINYFCAFRAFCVTLVILCDKGTKISGNKKETPVIGVPMP